MRAVMKNDEVAAGFIARLGAEKATENRDVAENRNLRRAIALDLLDEATDGQSEPTLDGDAALRAPCRDDRESPRPKPRRSSPRLYGC